MPVSATTSLPASPRTCPPPQPATEASAKASHAAPSKQRPIENIWCGHYQMRAFVQHRGGSYVCAVETDAPGAHPTLHHVSRVRRRSARRKSGCVGDGLGLWLAVLSRGADALQRESHGAPRRSRLSIQSRRDGHARIRGRANPTCAVQDCATGKTIDDGCSEDGRCLACINQCPQSSVPTGRP
jgi:hypothetical protein